MAAPSLVIKIAADLAGLRAALADGETHVKAVATNIGKLSDSFRGEKLIADANRMVVAIEQIGGAAKLTEKEQARVNATVSQAIEKYTLMGKAAPAELLALEQATRGVERATVSATQATGNLSAKMVGLAAGIGAALGMAAYEGLKRLGGALAEMATHGVKLAGVTTSFQALTASINETSATMLGAGRTATRGLVGDLDLMQAANKGMLLGLPITSQSFGTMATAAVVLGKAMNQGPTKSLDDLMTALGRSSPMILDNLGLSVKVGEANETYAKSLGKTAEQLTDSEKKMAFYNAAMDAAQKKVADLGGIHLTLGDQVIRAKTYVTNITDAFGVAIAQSPVLAEGMGAIGDAISAAFGTDHGALIDQFILAINRVAIGLVDAGRYAVEFGHATGMVLGALLAPIGAVGTALILIHEALSKATAMAAKLASAMTFGEMSKGWDQIAQSAQRMGDSSEAAGFAVARFTKASALAAIGQDGLHDTLTAVGTRLLDAKTRMEAASHVTGTYTAETNKLGRAHQGLDADVAATAAKLKILAGDTETVVAIMNRYGLSVIPVATGATGALARALADAHAGIILATRDFSALSGTIPAFTAEVTGNMEAFADAQPVIKTWGETFTDVLAGIPQLVANAFTGGGGIGGALKGMVSSFGSAGIGKLFSSLAEGVGGVLGAVLPGLGAAIGSLIGPLVQQISELFSKPVWKDITSRVGTQWGVEISEGLAKSIETETARLFGGSRQAAELFNLDKIIGEAGGVDANLASIDKWSRALRDVFSMIETGQMSVAQGSEAVTKTFPLLAAAWQESGETASEQFIELIALNARFGTESKAITDFIGGQWTRLADMAAQSGGLMTQQFLDLIPLASQFGDEAEAAMQKFTAGQLQGGVDGIAVMIEGWAHGAAGTQEEFDRMGRLAAASLGALTAQGGSLYDALAKLQPAIGQLTEASQTFGFESSAAFAEMARMAETVQLNPDLFAQMDGVQQAMVGWHNSGLMNQQLFADLTASIGDTGRQLELQGRGGQQALQLLAGPLQTAWELQTDFGYVTDEATAKMIDQAVEAGVVGEAHRSAQDIAARAMQTVVDLLGRIAVALGAELPESMATASSAASTEAGSMTASFAGTEAAAKANALNTQAEWASKLSALSADAQIKTGQVSGAFGTAETAIKGSVGAVRDAWLAKFHEMQRGADDLTRQAGSSVASNLNAGLGAVDWDGFVSAGEDAMSRVQRAAETAAWGSSPGGVREIGTQATLALTDVHQLAVGLERSALRFEHLALSNRLSDTAVRHVRAPASPPSATYSTGPITIQIVQRPGENAQQLAERVAETLPRVWQRNYKQSRNEAQAALGVEA